jgi:hypothetical protein
MVTKARNCILLSCGGKNRMGECEGEDEGEASVWSLRERDARCYIPLHLVRDGDDGRPSAAVDKCAVDPVPKILGREVRADGS